jgi:hypothetical protein
VRDASLLAAVPVAELRELEGVVGPTAARLGYVPE